MLLSSCLLNVLKSNAFSIAKSCSGSVQDNFKCIETLFAVFVRSKHKHRENFTSLHSLSLGVARLGQGDCGSVVKLRVELTTIKNC